MLRCNLCHRQSRTSPLINSPFFAIFCKMQNRTHRMPKQIDLYRQSIQNSRLRFTRVPVVYTYDIKGTHEHIYELKGEPCTQPDHSWFRFVLITQGFFELCFELVFYPINYFIHFFKSIYGWLSVIQCYP